MGTRDDRAQSRAHDRVHNSKTVLSTMIVSLQNEANVIQRKITVGTIERDELTKNIEGFHNKLADINHELKLLETRQTGGSVIESSS